MPATDGGRVSGVSEIDGVCYMSNNYDEIYLVEEDDLAAIRLLQERGIIPIDFDPTRQVLHPVLKIKH